jgi:transcriptional regulator with XRE-family HTH domain
LRGPSSIITVTVRSLATSRGTGASLHALKSALLRWLTRRSPEAGERLQPVELPPQLIVLSHYQQAMQGLANDAELANAIGVAPSEVEQWKTGQVPSDEKLRRLRDIATIVARLAEYYDAAAIPDWLFGRNPDLGGRQPIELLREGNLADVLSVAEAQISGAYI